MGRNDDTWSDRHRAAIGYAQAEMGYSSTEATAAGKRGELGLPSFEMSESMAREIGQAYRRGEIEPPKIREDADDNNRRVQAFINQRLGALLAQDHPKHWEIKHLLELQAANIGRRTPQPPKQNPPTAREDTQSLLAQLQDAQPPPHRDSNPSDTDPNPPHQQHSDAGSVPRT